MRTIKFRGKKIDNGEWIFGDLMHDTLVWNVYKSPTLRCEGSGEPIKLEEI